MKDISQNYYYLSKIINKGSKLIIRLKKTGCSSCSEKKLNPIIKNFNNIINLFCKHNFIIIAIFKDFREFYVFSRLNEIKSNIYYTSPDDNIIPRFENDDEIYYFISDST